MHQFLNCNLRIVNVCADGITALAKVVRRHIGCHSDCDSRRSVQKQKRYFGREHRRLLERVVKVVLEIHRILLKVGQNLIRQFGELGLRVSHGSHRVTVHRTEVTLTEYQRISEAPVLGHPRHGVIYAAVSMRVILTEDFTHDTG